MPGWRAGGSSPEPAPASNALTRQLNRAYAWYASGFVLFVAAMGILERMGMPKNYIGFVFLLAPVAVYAGIGMLSRTSDPVEYYVAGRRVPAVYNGMATGADWMSAASFIGLAGTLYLTGYGGLAFILGWSGGFCLVALLLAPYLRKFGQFTIPDFLGARYEGNLPRIIGAAAAMLCSFTYVVAQIYGVGLITTRLSGLAFEIGVFVGLGGIVLCSFLGGMRAVTWTQVAQYIILIVAYLVPVVWLSVKQTGVPIPQAIYGMQLQKITAREKELVADPKEQQVIAAFKARAAQLGAKLTNVPAALAADRTAAQRKLDALKAANASLADIQRARRELVALPKTEVEAGRVWAAAEAANEARARPLAGMPPHAQSFAGDPGGDEHSRGAFDESRRNFLALVLCLMLGTAALPHVLVRYYTTPSVKEARESVAWSLFFIFLLYCTAPALAVLVKFEVFNSLVGTPFDQLPSWISTWSRVDPSALSVIDINGDGILQLGELNIGADIIVLAAPEIGGLPYVISGMVAAGGLAAALSTADSLMLTISNALGHDLYYKMIDPNASTARRVTVSKALMLVVALAAAAVAVQSPPDILVLVSAAFSIAAAAFFPALVLGVFWKRANKWGASAGMLTGLATTIFYMVTTDPWLRSLFGVTSSVTLWWRIQPISSGLFGVVTGIVTIVVVSLLTPAPAAESQRLVNELRYPDLYPRG